MKNYWVRNQEASATFRIGSDPLLSVRNLLILGACNEH